MLGTVRDRGQVSVKAERLTGQAEGRELLQKRRKISTFCCQKRIVRRVFEI